MTHRLLTLIACACLLCPSAYGQNKPAAVTKMGSGLTLVVQEDYSADLIAVDVWVKAGSANETPQTNGISHLIEHLVFGATRTRKAADVDREIESLGASLDARTSRDWAHFSTTIASRHLSKALDVLADVLSGAQFLAEDLNAERPVILDELATKESNAMKVCRDHLAARIYGDHPYSLPVEGSADTIKSITRQDILDYYRRYYVASNMAIVLVGAIDTQHAAAEVGKAFERISGANVPSTDPGPVSPPTEQITDGIPASFRFNHLAIGFLGPEGTEAADVCATDVLLAYLGFGYRSWMSEQLVGQLGLAIDAEADFLTHRRQGLISLIAATTDENLDKARGAVFARLTSLRSNGITEAELALAKRSLLGQVAFQNETFEGRANNLGFLYAVADDPRLFAGYMDGIQAVDNDDIVRVARRYLDPAKAVVLTIGKKQGGAQ